MMWALSAPNLYDAKTKKTNVELINQIHALPIEVQSFFWLHFELNVVTSMLICWFQTKIVDFK